MQHWRSKDWQIFRALNIPFAILRLQQIWASIPVSRYGNSVSKSRGPKKNLTQAFQLSVGQAFTPYE